MPPTHNRLVCTHRLSSTRVCRHYSTNSEAVEDHPAPSVETQESDYHSIIKDSERGTGEQSFCYLQYNRSM